MVNRTLPMAIRGGERLVHQGPARHVQRGDDLGNAAALGTREHGPGEQHAGHKTGGRDHERQPGPAGGRDGEKPAGKIGRLGKEERGGPDQHGPDPECRAPHRTGQHAGAVDSKRLDSGAPNGSHYVLDLTRRSRHGCFEQTGNVVMLANALPSRSTEPAETAASMPSLARHGRGATVNPAVRFDRLHGEAFDDGWGTLEETFADLPPLPTTLIKDSSRSVISWNTSPDLGFDRAVNPYRGCEHGCIYCYARPSHAYLGYSPGLDFETKLVFKPDVAEQLERELRKPGYVARPLALGSNTDPYQPVERTLKLTRAVLEVLERFGHPLSIVTKSAGVVRDSDILGRMAKRGLVRVWLSVTTLDPALARKMEPRAAAPARRLAAVTALATAGIPVGVLAAPMIPGLNDAEMERILAAASEAGAGTASYVLLRLPLEGAADVRGLAGAAFPGPCPPRAQPGAGNAQRRAERLEVPQPVRRQRGLCRPARTAVQPGGPAARAVRARGPRLLAVHAATGVWRVCRDADVVVLTVCPRFFSMRGMSSLGGHVLAPSAIPCSRARNRLISQL